MNQAAREPRDRGAVIPFIAISLAVLVLMTSFAVDLGRQMLKRRDIQAVADVVALDLGRHLTGDVTSWYTSGAGSAQWSALVTESRTRNNFLAPDTTGVHSLTWQLGVVNQTTRVFTPTLATEIPDAVKVTVTDTINYFFAPGTGSATRWAVAGSSGLVDWNIGSFLASVDPLQQGILNRWLGNAFIGAPINLTALSYQGLANANVGLGALAAQMGFGTPDDLLTSDVAARDVILATAQVLSAEGGNVATINALNALGGSMGSSSTVRLGEMIEVAQGGPSSAADTQINVLQLLTGSASLINGSSLVSMPGLTVTIPGVTSVDVQLRIIQDKEYCVGCPVGEPRTNNQVELIVTPHIDRDLSAFLAGARLHGTMTISTTVAGATGTATAIRCGSAKGVDLSVTPKPVTVTGSQALTLDARVLFIVIPVLGINVNGAVLTATGSAESATFDYPTDFGPDAGTAAPVRLGSAALPLPTLLAASTTNATVLGGTIALGSLLNVANQGILPILTGVQNLVISQITKALGVDLGGGDVSPTEMYCTGPTLLG